MNLYYVDINWGVTNTSYHVACESFSHAVQIITYEIGDDASPTSLNIQCMGRWDNEASLLLSSDYDDILK